MTSVISAAQMTVARGSASHPHVNASDVHTVPPTPRFYRFQRAAQAQQFGAKLAGRRFGGAPAVEAPAGAAAPAPQAVAAPPATPSQWEAQSRIRALVAQRLGVSEEEAGARLAQLAQLLPGLHAQLPGMEPAAVARMAADVTAVAARLLQLRAIFPGADAFQLALREPFLVYGTTIFRLQRAAAELRALLPGLDVDRLVEAHPSLLDVKTTRRAIKEFRRAEPSLDVNQVLALDPSMPFRFSLRRANLSGAIGRRSAPAGAAPAASQSA